MSDFAIQTQALTKNYASVRALRGVDLEVHQGEIFGFLGPNGAGKTTTIRCLLDLIHPNGGRISVLGLDPQKDPVAVRARSGYLPGELRMEENFSGEGILRYLKALRGNQTDWDYTRQIAARLDFDLKTLVKNLSKGNKQKLGVIQALMHRPDLLLLDEPTAGLDPLMQQEVLNIIRAARDDGATVFFSSHLIHEVEVIADRVGIIRNGKVVEVAQPSALINRSLRQVRIRFKEKVSEQELTQVPGVSLLGGEDGLSVILKVEGEMDALIKALAKYPVSNFETERQSLEEIFMTYYAQHSSSKNNQVDAAHEEA